MRFIHLVNPFGGSVLPGAAAASRARDAPVLLFIITLRCLNNSLLLRRSITGTGLNSLRGTHGAEREKHANKQEKVKGESELSQSPNSIRPRGSKISSRLCLSSTTLEAENVVPRVVT